MREPRISDYLELLNEEDDVGGQAAETLLAAPAEAWPDVLHAHPEWLRFGTFDRLLAIAHDYLYRAPLRSLDIANLVIQHIDAIPHVFPEDFLYVQLRGLAWKELANALYTLRRFQEAEVPALAAVSTFAEEPVLAVDRANARFVQAEIWHEMGRTDDALKAMDDAIHVYAAYGDAQHYLYAIEFLGMIEFDRGNYAEAYELFTTAIEEAESLHDVQAEARSRSNRGACEVRLGRYLEATEDLRRAVTALTALDMHAAVPDSIWNFAKLLRDQGDLEEARATLEGVYAGFLRLGMIGHAMSVLVELSAVIAEFDGDVPKARLLCGRFVQAIGPYETEDSVRAAADYLARATLEAETPAEFVAAVAPVREFCRNPERSPSAVFVPPDSMTA
jgi:tetratricopeptide (TPR) repeat protein